MAILKNKTFVLLGLAALVLPALVLPSKRLVSQVKIQAQEAVVADEVTVTRADEKKTKENEEKYAGGAALKTDSDMEDQLKRAATFVAEKNYRNATILWDRVLSQSENSLITRDGETYISLVRQVEDTIRGLPPNGLQVYRISADGKAKGLMPGSPAEASEESLNKLVRLYFMSSIGDDAAYELGCRALDRRDFVSASRLFSKILNEHPDPSVDKGELLVRSAIASGNLGDREAAMQSLEDAENGENKPSETLLVNVKNHLEFLKESTGVVAEGGESIAMRLSGSDRSGVMPDLPADALNGDLTQGYEFRFPFVFSGNKGDTDLGKVLRGGAAGAEKVDAGITSLSQKWKDKKWFPTNQLLFANGKIILKTTNDLVCIDADGQSDLARWHSLWLNHFDLDEASWNAKTYGQQQRNRSGSALPISFPADVKESWYFYDKIRQSMSIHNGVVYTIEGKSYSQLDDSVPRTRRSTTARSFNQPVNLTRSRTNYLTAYNLRTGKVLWTRSAYEKPEKTEEEDDAALDSKVGFLGTPVPFGNLILCPVTEGGAISIFAMDSTNKGKTVWKTFLCDDPSEGVNHFSPVEITIAGQDAYATCGSGVLFALNATTGNIQFARRYKRDGSQAKVMTSYNQHQQMLKADGWDEDIVITWRNALVVMASDHDYLFAIDRRNGKFLWDAPRLPFDEDVNHAYCLGHHDDKLLMATNKAILCYNLAGDGKLHWYQKFGGNSFGRGFITTKAAYIPVEDSIIKFDLQTGKKLAQVGVNLGSENKVGNLFSDGKQLWVAGLNRVTALRSLRDRLVELGTKIEGGDQAALQERLKIYAKLKEHDKALADAFKLFELTSDKSEGYLGLVQNLTESEITKHSATKSLSALDQMITNEGTRTALLEKLKTNYNVFFNAASEAVSAGDQTAVSTVLSWSGLKISEGFSSAVTKFLANHPPAIEKLDSILSKADERQQLMLIPVVAKAKSPNSVLISLLASEAESVQIASATQLALLADKSCLATALKLLSSESEMHRVEAFLILKNMTRAKIDFDANGSDEDRQKSVDQWKKWLEDNGEGLEVKTPVKLRFGKVVVATSSKIMEFDLDGKFTKLGDQKGFRPEDLIASRNGNRIVAEYSPPRIVELNLSGKEISKVMPQYSPRSVRKLANGNYLVAWRNSSKPVVELDPQGKVVWESKSFSGYAQSAERLKSGNTLIALEKRVVEVDANSSIVFELGRAQGVTSCKEAKRLANGNTLVVHGTIVSIFDKDKNPVLRIKGSFTPKSAIQLEDGRILVAHATGLRMFDKEGTKIGDDFVNENVNSVWEY